MDQSDGLEHPLAHNQPPTSGRFLHSPIEHDAFADDLDDSLFLDPVQTQASADLSHPGAQPGTEHHNSLLSPEECFQDWLDELTGGDPAHFQFLMSQPTGFSSGASDFDFSLLDSPRRTPGRGQKKTEAAIPVERLSEIQQHWPTQIINSNASRTNLWCALWTCQSGNLITDVTLGLADSPEAGSRWCLSHETRSRIHLYINSSQDQCSTPHPNSSDIKLPPKEILDVGLELFFRHFHALSPFVHMPTFRPNLAPVPILLSMCLIGIHILNTKAANPLLSRIKLVCPHFPQCQAKGTD